jgi:hypothetical protein
MVRGAYIGSDTFRTVRHQAVGLVALFAILLHVAIPTLYDIAPPAVQGLMQITICAGGEARQVVVDETGKPVKQVPADNHNCHSCMQHCGVLALAAVADLLPVAFAVVIFSPVSAALHSLFFASGHARGPPL